jgi:AraC-like DNA-binding protein
MPMLSHVPDAPLSALVQRIWDWEEPPQPFRRERLLPVAHANLIINLAEDASRLYDEDGRCHSFRGATLEGPRHISSIIDTLEQVAVIGVVFQPAAAVGLFRERMDLLANRCVNLQDLVGPHAEQQLRERLLEAGSAGARVHCLQAWLHGLMVQSPIATPAPAVLQMLDTLDRHPHIAALARCARDTGLSPRTLRERFRQQVGLSPKRYLRLQRFHRLLAAGAASARNPDWADLAAQGGYCDQAHLSHEFRRFSGLSPAEFSRRGIWSGHLPLD